MGSCQKGIHERITWEQRKLGDIFKFAGSGGTPAANNPEYYGGSIPFLGISDIRDREISSTEKTLTEKGLANSAAWIVPAGAISLAMYASVGKVGILSQDTATSQAFYNMVFAGDSLRDFVYTQLERAGEGDGWEPYISTGTQRNLNAEKVKEYGIKIPSSEETALVASFFQKLDSLVTLHQREGRACSVCWLRLALGASCRFVSVSALG